MWLQIVFDMTDLILRCGLVLVDGFFQNLYTRVGRNVNNKVAVPNTFPAASLRSVCWFREKQILIGFFATLHSLVCLHRRGNLTTAFSARPNWSPTFAEFSFLLHRTYAPNLPSFCVIRQQLVRKNAYSVSAVPFIKTLTC